MSQEDVLKEILILVRENSNNIALLKKEMREEIEKLRKELLTEEKVREIVKEMLDESIEKLRSELLTEEKVKEMINESILKFSSEVGKQLNEVMEVIQKHERREHQKISQELKEHKANAVNGVLLLKQSLVR